MKPAVGQRWNWKYGDTNFVAEVTEVAKSKDSGKLTVRIQIVSVTTGGYKVGESMQSYGLRVIANGGRESAWTYLEGQDRE